MQRRRRPWFLRPVTIFLVAFALAAIVPGFLPRKGGYRCFFHLPDGLVYYETQTERCEVRDGEKLLQSYECTVRSECRVEKIPNAYMISIRPLTVTATVDGKPDRITTLERQMGMTCQISQYGRLESSSFGSRGLADLQAGLEKQLGKRYDSSLVDRCTERQYRHVTSRWSGWLGWFNNLTVATGQSWESRQPVHLRDGTSLDMPIVCRVAGTEMREGAKCLRVHFTNAPNSSAKLGERDLIIEGDALIRPDGIRVYSISQRVTIVANASGRTTVLESSSEFDYAGGISPTPGGGH